MDLPVATTDKLRYCPKCKLNTALPTRQKWCIVCRAKLEPLPSHRLGWRKQAIKARDSYGLREIPAPPGIIEREVPG